MEQNLDDLTPKIVYKYRDFNDNNHKRIITHQEIYFAKPSEFLDPYDCRYKIDKVFIKDEKNRRTYYAKKLKTNNLFDPKITQLIKENPVTDSLIEIQENEIQKILNRIYGIFSVSRNYKNTHLWKIFGGNNKGFCVGLDFQGILPLNEGTKGRVVYKEKDQLPKSKVLNSDNDMEMIKYVFDSILTLPIVHSNEQEYRMQKTFFKDSDRYIKLDKKYIQSIILGYKMTEPKRRELIELINEHLPKTKIKRLKYKNGELIEIDLK